MHGKVTRALQAVRYTQQQASPLCGCPGGDGSARWRLACGFVGSGPRGRGYTGGKISACCLVIRNV